MKLRMNDVLATAISIITITTITTTTTSTTTITTITTTTTSTTTITTITTTTTSTTITTITTTTTSTTITTITTTTTSTTTTTPRPMCKITASDDPIKSLYDTVAGGPTVGFEGRYSIYGEKPPEAIDNNVNTKYLNYGTTSAAFLMSTNPGKDSGFYVTPNVGASLANGILFATANDFPGRDPLTITLEGTNSTNLHSSSVWTLLYNGSTGLDLVTTRSSYGSSVAFTNNVSYISYRLLVLTQRDISDSVQYAESHIMRYC